MSARRMRRWSNRSGVVEPGRVVHRDLGAEAAVAEVRPVADLAVADAHDVGQAVAGHVGQVDRLRAVGEDDRGPLLFVERHAHAQRRAETVLSKRWMPGEGVVLGDQHVGDARRRSRSTKRRLGSLQSRTGSERNARNPPQSGLRRCARKSRARTKKKSTRSSLPSPARSISCCAPSSKRRRARADSRPPRSRRTGLRRDSAYRTRRPTCSVRTPEMPSPSRSSQR